MRKVILTIALAAACVLGAFGFKHNVHASTNDNYKCYSVSSLSSEKVGNYYMSSNDDDDTVFKKAAKGKTYLKIENVSQNIVTNGTYAFYVNYTNNSLYRTTLSTKKTVRLAKLKGDDYYVNHVYAGSIYLNNCNPDDSCTIKVFNMGKKTLKTVEKKAFDDPISGSGVNLVYKQYNTDKLYLRNCKTGKSTELKALKYAQVYKVSGNKIAYVKYKEATDEYVVYTYNITTQKVTTVKAIGGDFFTAIGDFNDNLTQYTFDNQVLDMTTGVIK